MPGPEHARVKVGLVVWMFVVVLLALCAESAVAFVAPVAPRAGPASVPTTPAPMLRAPTTTKKTTSLATRPARNDMKRGIFSFRGFAAEGLTSLGSTLGKYAIACGVVVVVLSAVLEIKILKWAVFGAVFFGGLFVLVFPESPDWYLTYREDRLNKRAEKKKQRGAAA
mmetsp:Transcript_27779/g.85207  ORF Transcript_27779/g.85207 Transcript_27779/m.85207 type:complete len:168 (-) Transcript_27779:1937-2440(-)